MNLFYLMQICIFVYACTYACIYLLFRYLLICVCEWGFEVFALDYVSATAVFIKTLTIHLFLLVKYMLFEKKISVQYLKTFRAHGDIK